MEKQENEFNLISENGDVLKTEQEILDYLDSTITMLRLIRKTPQFAREFASGDLSRYYELENNLKLSTTDNLKLDFDETYELVKKNR